MIDKKYNKYLMDTLTKAPYILTKQKAKEFIEALDKELIQYSIDKLKGFDKPTIPKDKSENGKCKNEFCPYHLENNCSSPNDEKDCKYRK